MHQGEAEAGRPAGVTKAWSVLATACDVSDEVYLKYIIARLATYLQIPGYGEMLVSINGWDLIHASTLEEFVPVLAEYEKIPPNALFEGRTNRPG